MGTGRTAVAISSGGSHTCAILDNGAVSCWGGNSNGQLGDGGTLTEVSTTPTSSLGNGRTAIAISAGGFLIPVPCWITARFHVGEAARMAV